MHLSQIYPLSWQLVDTCDACYSSFADKGYVLARGTTDDLSVVHRHATPTTVKVLHKTKVVVPNKWLL